MSAWAEAGVSVGHRDRAALADRVLVLGTAAGVAALGGAHGGYFPTSWGWCALMLAWLAAMALLVRAAVAVTRLELATVAAFAGLATWYGLSAFWSQSITQSVLEAERALVYPLATAAALLVSRHAAVPSLLAGVWGGVSLVCLYALGTRLFPGRFDAIGANVGRRLSEPIGYWNALGVFAAIGVLLALGLAVRSPSLLLRAGAAASLVVFLPTLYFTFSRGAWAALMVGIAVAVALEPRRLQLVAAGVPALVAPGIAVLLGARLHGLTDPNALPVTAAHDGRLLAGALIVLVAVAAIVPFLVARAEHRFDLPSPTRARISASLAVAILATAFVLVARAGGPASVVHHALDAFDAPAAPSVRSYNQRLFNLSGSGRNVQYRVAWNEFLAHPILGSGAGTYEQVWLRTRPRGDWKIRDAHSVYMETLGELGILGLGLLCVAFALPLLALRRARHRPLVPAAAGAYAAFLIHAGVDWDWELTGVMLPAVLCGVALLLSARASDPTGGAGVVRRLPALTALVGAAALAAVGLLGNAAVGRAQQAVQTQQWAKAERAARTALRWAPWSSQPLEWLGEAQVGGGDAAASRTTLRQAIAKDPRNWVLWFDLALAESHGGEAQLAALRRAFALNPRAPELHEFVRGARLRLPGTTS